MAMAHTRPRNTHSRHVARSELAGACSARAHRTRERLRSEAESDQAGGDGGYQGTRAAAAAAEGEWQEGQKCLRRASRLGHLEARFSLGALLLGQLVEERVRSGNAGDGSGAGEQNAAGRPEQEPSARHHCRYGMYFQ